MKNLKTKNISNTKFNNWAWWQFIR